MADQYGDSTLVRAVRERSWGLPAFRKGFKKSAGVSLADFEEEWRRAVTAYTYSLFAQKEQVGDVGEAVRSPSRLLTRVAYAPAGSLMAVLNRGGGGSLPTLVTITNDSLKQSREIDHGYFNGNFSFNGDATQLVYAKRHRSTHGSFLWDLKVADLHSGSTRWITSGRRASHPHWSSVADRIVYIAIDSSTTNLYSCNRHGQEVRRLTAFAPMRTTCRRARRCGTAVPAATREARWLSG
jgi:Tol biopolymer transport system component